MSDDKFRACLAETLKWEASVRPFEARFGGGNGGIDVAKRSEPLPETCTRNVLNTSDIREGEARPLPMEETRPAAVISLLLRRCPPAIAGLVSTGRIDSIECRARRAFPHIRKEGLEALAPFLAHGYAVSTVSRVRRMCRRMAALFRGLPASVCRRWLRFLVPRGRVAVPPSLDGNKCVAGAAAALYVASLQVMTGYGFYSPAVTSADPIHSTTFRGARFREVALYDRKHTVSVPGSVDQFAHVRSASS